MKRLFDIIFSLLGIVFFAPLMVLIALAIWLTSKGPVVYRQRRTGLREKPFYLYKFRTMVDRAETMGTSVTTDVDRRVTPAGRILRKAKLDELPQLFNVLAGDMSFVGPRPDVPEITGRYTDGMKRIFAVRPGITSVATLHFRREEEILAKVDNPDRFYEEAVVPLKVELAMEHVRRNSFLFDLKILGLTVWALTPFENAWPVKEHPLMRQFRDKYGL